ncbi:protein Spindly [Dioscorea cayenensis subsp. rotundata]|uniref:Protein Spindly n=1 Tax=Dioscorea cayennensis subsp. rotundata TaxID=55577 RepID=A0AB40ANU2_DIOCR|nr:protein Spindly [Dioscorea cayenensis subsp. rotundata]
MEMGDDCLESLREGVDGGEYAMWFGISCAFAALGVVEMEGKRLELSELMMRGSTQLLGLMVERRQRKVEALEEKMKRAEMEVKEMKLRRREDAKANEKVVAIFASHEQSWIAERKRLGFQIQTLVRELRGSKEVVEEKEGVIRAKDEELEKGLKERKELEERMKKEEEEHSAELWKHKTAFMELVSDQRQLEAEMGRVLRQAETAKRELEELSEKKEEAVAMVDKLSDEILKLQKDAEQKDKILSAMLRKSKIDSAEKQMLLKEVKISKAKKKQAEMEMDRWRSLCESRNKKSLRALPLMEAGSSRANNSETSITETESFDHCSSCQVNAELGCVDDMQKLRDWVRMEAEKYAMVLEQRHYAEIEAFTEQMRLKDEKLEAFRWQLLSVELEAKQLQSHIEGLDGTVSQFRDENLRLETLLLEKEKELKLLRDQLDFYNVQHYQKKKERSSGDSSMNDFASQDNQVDEFYVEQCEETANNLILTSKNSEEIEEEKVVSIDPGHITSQNNSKEQSVAIVKNNNSWKMDIHALGISYKIKRLKQQLIVLEKLTGEQAMKQTATADDSQRKVGAGGENKQQVKGLLLLISLLNKQVKRYQSLEEKTDELCRKMNESHRTVGKRDQFNNGKTKEQTETLQKFLEETFQLQRFMVATGQKLMDIEAKIACSFVGNVGLDESSGFNMSQFADIVKNLFKEVQRGLEVRIARIIGDLEGTLACDGILYR